MSASTLRIARLRSAALRRVCSLCQRFVPFLGGSFCFGGFFGAGRFRVMHPKCVVARYVGEILRQAPEADVLVVIAANCGRCVRSTKFCVFVVQHAHTREECEEKLKVLIVEMKAEIVEAQRLKDLGESDGRPTEGKEGS